jgi:hypothetical protein
MRFFVVCTLGALVALVSAQAMRNTESAEEQFSSMRFQTAVRQAAVVIDRAYSEKTVDGGAIADLAGVWRALGQDPVWTEKILPAGKKLSIQDREAKAVVWYNAMRQELEAATPENLPSRERLHDVLNEISFAGLSGWQRSLTVLSVAAMLITAIGLIGIVFYALKEWFEDREFERQRQFREWKAQEEARQGNAGGQRRSLLKRDCACRTSSTRRFSLSHLN